MNLNKIKFKIGPTVKHKRSWDKFYKVLVLTANLV